VVDSQVRWVKHSTWSQDVVTATSVRRADTISLCVFVSISRNQIFVAQTL